MIGQFEAVVELLWLRAGGFVGEHEQLRVLRHDLAREHILLAKLRHEDLRVGVAIPIIEDMNEAVGGFEAIGIGHRIALIKQQSAFPRLAFVFGQPRAHMRALLQALRRRSILNQQDAPRFEPTQEEACVHILHRRCLFRLAPRFATIGRETLVWLALRACEHPQMWSKRLAWVCLFSRRDACTTLQLDHHVLVELPIRELQMAALLPRRAFIGRFKHTAGLLMPIRHRQQPRAVLEHRRFVQRATFRKHHRRAPHWLRRIGIIAAHEPVRDALLRIAELLIKKQPQTPLRIGPKIPHQRPADLLRRLHPRPDRQTRLRPRRAIVIARRQQEIPIRLVPRPRPAAPNPPLRRPIHPDDHRATPCVVLKLRAGSHHHRGRQSILISNLRPIREHQQHHLLELKPLTCLHRLVVKAHAIHLPRKKLHFRAIDLQEARLSQRLLLTRRFGSSRRSQRKQRSGLGDSHVELFDAGAVKRQVFDRIGHFIDDILAVSKESHTAFHHRRFIRNQRSGEEAKEKG